MKVNKNINLMLGFHKDGTITKAIVDNKGNVLREKIVVNLFKINSTQKFKERYQKAFNYRREK